MKHQSAKMISSFQFDSKFFLVFVQFIEILFCNATNRSNKKIGIVIAIEKPESNPKEGIKMINIDIKLNTIFFL